jgi:alanyl-tRNA synthetase
VGKFDGKATLSIIIDEELAKSERFHAGNLVREASKLIQGGGGGQPFFCNSWWKRQQWLDGCN